MLEIHVFRLSKKSEFTEQDNVCYYKKYIQGCTHLYRWRLPNKNIYTYPCIFTDDRFL